MKYSKKGERPHLHARPGEQTLQRLFDFHRRMSTRGRRSPRGVILG